MHDRLHGDDIGGFLAALAPTSNFRAAAIAKCLTTLTERCPYLVPKHDPANPEFDNLCHGRGPVWLIPNSMIMDGLAKAGVTAMADRIVANSLRLIERSCVAK